MNFDAFVNDIKDHGWKVFGTEVYEFGKLIHSYGDTSGLHEIYSATKTVLSAAVGIAYDEGLIDPYEPVIKYLPAERTASFSEKQKAIFSSITIKRLLTMSVSGFPFRPEGDDWLDFSLSCDICDTSVKEFHYNNISAYLVGVCLTEALGSDLGSFIEERLFAPMHITEYEYSRSPEGYFYGASGMKLSVHDLSKFGLLFYGRGVYDGVRIFSEQYAETATSVQQMNREGGYGFFIWKYRGGFSINGKWKQKCYVLPASGLMVTYLSHIEDDSHDLLDSCEENIFDIGEAEKEAFSRIARMEELYDRACAGKASPEDMERLSDYYSGPYWRRDFELDEAGLLPAYLKRGVLSEDGLYNLFE